ncbi:MAG: leucine-rich repeat protein [Oscillibacter sp.]|nr:leucine-rich repeat protein [Oscillibacter sp.]
MNSCSIHASSFKGCVNLKDIFLPNTVTKLSRTTFKDCKELTIHVPAASFAKSFAKELLISFQAC